MICEIRSFLLEFQLGNEMEGGKSGEASDLSLEMVEHVNDKFVCAHCDCCVGNSTHQLHR